MKQINRGKLLCWLALGAIVALGGCAVLRIDVDVYKGSLANADDGALEGLMAKVAGARTVMDKLMQAEDSSLFPVSKDEIKRILAYFGDPKIDAGNVELEIDSMSPYLGDVHHPEFNYRIVGPNKENPPSIEWLFNRYKQAKAEYTARKLEADIKQQQSEPAAGNDATAALMTARAEMNYRKMQLLERIVYCASRMLNLPNSKPYQNINDSRLIKIIKPVAGLFDGRLDNSAGLYQLMQVMGNTMMVEADEIIRRDNHTLQQTSETSVYVEFRSLQNITENSLQIAYALENGQAKLPGSGKSNTVTVTQQWKNAKLPEFDPGKFHSVIEVDDAYISALQFLQSQAIQDDHSNSAHDRPALPDMHEFPADADPLRAVKIANALKAARTIRASNVYIASATNYLRSTLPATIFQDNPPIHAGNMLFQGAMDTVTDIPDKLTDAIFPDADAQGLHDLLDADKQSWQNINQVKVTGSGDTNYVVAKDDVGNWYVKNYSADPRDIINSAKSLALFSMSPAVGSNLLAAAAGGADAGGTGGTGGAGGGGGGGSPPSVAPPKSFRTKQTSTLAQAFIATTRSDRDQAEAARQSLPAAAQKLRSPQDATQPHQIDWVTSSAAVALEDKITSKSNQTYPEFRKNFEVIIGAIQKTRKSLLAGFNAFEQPTLARLQAAVASTTDTALKAAAEATLKTEQESAAATIRQINELCDTRLAEILSRRQTHLADFEAKLEMIAQFSPNAQPTDALAVVAK